MNYLDLDDLYTSEFDLHTINEKDEMMYIKPKNRSTISVFIILSRTSVESWFGSSYKIWN